MRKRTEEAGEEIERILVEDPPLHREAWQRLRVWYKAEVDRAPLRAQVALERITTECMDLYRQVPPPGENIPISVDPFQVADLVHI